VLAPLVVSFLPTWFVIIIASFIRSRYLDGWVDERPLRRKRLAGATEFRRSRALLTRSYVLAQAQLDVAKPLHARIQIARVQP
jgi:hypothetical protein